jgi:hypothetical protein
MSWVKIGLSSMFNARFAKVMGKEKLHTPKFEFLYKHNSKKKVVEPPCLVFLTICSTRLRIVKYVLWIMNCYMILEVRKLCKTWYARYATWGLEESHLFCYIFPPTMRGKTMIEYESMNGLLHYKSRIVHRSIGAIKLVVHGWNNAH